MKRFSFYWVLFIPVLLQAQSKVAVDPVITPALFQPDTEITVTYDVTGTSSGNTHQCLGLGVDTGQKH
jgi:hypothetical protein